MQGRSSSSYLTLIDNIIMNEKAGMDKQKEVMQKYYGKKGVTKKQQEMIKKIVRDTGALTYSQKKISALTTKAKRTIPLVTTNSEKQTLLRELCDLLLTRNE